MLKLGSLNNELGALKPLTWNEKGLKLIVEYVNVHDTFCYLYTFLFIILHVMNDDIIILFIGLRIYT